MLEFIVLGVIPGTHIQLTFGWMAAIVLPIAAVMLLAFNFGRLNRAAKTFVEKLAATQLLAHK